MCNWFCFDILMLMNKPVVSSEWCGEITSCLKELWKCNNIIKIEFLKSDLEYNSIGLHLGPFKSEGIDWVEVYEDPAEDQFLLSEGENLIMI